MAEGTIIKAMSGFYYVSCEGRTVTCRARGRFRYEKKHPLVGDRVLFTEDGENGVVDEILPRKNEFYRPPVANIDRMVLVVTNALPAADTLLMDRMIAVAEHFGTDTVVCVNKCDLADGSNLRDIYTKAGYKTVLTSAVTGEGIDELRSAISEGVSAFAGNTGAGKSSLLNVLMPGLELETGDVSVKLGRGRHTTRHTEIYPLAGGGMIADTPGFSMFDTDELGFMPEEIQHMFRDFQPYLGQCEFDDCIHTAGRGCAVVKAVKDGYISQSRYNGYLNLVQEAKTHNFWEKK